MIAAVRLKWISILSLVISLFFFLWAIYNTFNDYQDGLLIQKRIDDGLVCFPFTILSSVIGFLSLSSPSLQSSHAPGLFILFSYALTVSIFLSAAICLTSSSLHRAYLIISALVWGAYGLLFFKEINFFRKEKLKEYSNRLLQFTKTESQC
jgi:FtsH-binding integral membrane protein